MRGPITVVDAGPFAPGDRVVLVDADGDRELMVVTRVTRFTLDVRKPRSGWWVFAGVVLALAAGVLLSQVLR